MSILAYLPSFDLNNYNNNKTLQVFPVQNNNLPLSFCKVNNKKIQLLPEFDLNQQPYRT